MVGRQRDSKIGYLAEVSAGDVIQILWVSPKLKFGFVGSSTPRIGEIFQCVRKGRDGFLVSRPDGGRSCLPFSSQEEIAVEFLNGAGPDAA